MKQIKNFYSFVNEVLNPGPPQKGDAEVMGKMIRKAYDKKYDSGDVLYGGENDEFFNFYVFNADSDEAMMASKVLENPDVFGDYVSFEMEDLTIKLYHELKAQGINVPDNYGKYVIHVRVAKQHPNKNIFKN